MRLHVVNDHDMQLFDQVVHAPNVFPDFEYIKDIFSVILNLRPRNMHVTLYFQVTCLHNVGMVIKLMISMKV